MIQRSEVGGAACLVLRSCGAASTGNGNGFRTDRSAFACLSPSRCQDWLLVNDLKPSRRGGGGARPCESHVVFRTEAKRRLADAAAKKRPELWLRSAGPLPLRIRLPGLATEERRRKEKSRRRRSRKRGRERDRDPKRRASKHAR